MAPLAARRTADMIALGRRIAAIELAVAAQAAELRGTDPLGRGTAAAIRTIRQVIPFLAPGAFVPDVEPLADRIAAGDFDPRALLDTR